MTNPDPAGGEFTNQRHTPPDLKWLLNERAAVLGDIERLDKQQESLSRDVERAQDHLLKCSAVLARSAERQARLKQSLASLDRCIEMAHAGVNPGAGGVVNAWAGKYGTRGAMNEFIACSLKAVAPFAVSSKVLAGMAQSHFAISFPLRMDRRSHQISIKKALKRLERKGLAHRLHSGRGSAVGIWQWAGDSLPTLTQMAQADQAARGLRGGATGDAVPDTAGPQVAPEREGSSCG